MSAAGSRLHEHARKLGHTIHVVRSMEEFLNILTAGKTG